MTDLNDVTPLPQLKGAQLLEQLVVDELRRRQRSRGNKSLLWPFPPCPVCGQHVDAQAFTLGVDDFDDRVLRNDPCGHRVKCSMKAVAQLVDQAQVLADEREAGPVAGGKPAQAATEATEPAAEDSELESLRREVAAARRFAAEMREFCSPHGVAADYADRLIEAMDRAKEEGR